MAGLGLRANFFQTTPNAQPSRRTQEPPFKHSLRTNTLEGGMFERLKWVSSEKWDLLTTPRAVFAFEDWGHLPITHPNIVQSMTIIIPTFARSVQLKVELPADPANSANGVTLRQVMIAMHKAMTAEITQEDYAKFMEEGFEDTLTWAMEERGETSNEDGSKPCVMRYCDMTWLDWPIVVKALERPYTGPNSTAPWMVDYMCEA